MKKYAVLIIIALLALALIACGSKTAAEPGEAAGADAPADAEAPAAEGFEAVPQDTPFGQYRSVEELIAILNGEAEDERADAPSFEAPAPDAEDESAPKDYAGAEYTSVFSDEPWEESGMEFARFDENGQATDEVPEPAAGWDSEYTAGLPAPAGSAPQIMEENGEFVAIVTLADAAQYDEYIAAVKSAGFTSGASEEDLSGYGMDMKMFSASHKDGRAITLTLSELTLTIDITK